MANDFNKEFTETLQKMASDLGLDIKIVTGGSIQDIIDDMSKSSQVEPNDPAHDFGVKSPGNMAGTARRVDLSKAAPSVTAAPSFKTPTLLTTKAPGPTKSFNNSLGNSVHQFDLPGVKPEGLTVKHNGSFLEVFAERFDTKAYTLYSVFIGPETSVEILDATFEACVLSVTLGAKATKASTQVTVPFKTK